MVFNIIHVEIYCIFHENQLKIIQLTTFPKKSPKYANKKPFIGIPKEEDAIKMVNIKSIPLYK